MNVFERAVSMYMTRTLAAVSPTTPIDAVLRMLHARRLTALPVVDAANVPLGIVSLSDLVRLGVAAAALTGSARSLPLPNRTAGDVMTPTPVTVVPSATLSAAARVMLDRSIHRVLVVENEKLVGVLSTLDLATAVYDARIESPLSAWMSSPVVTVDAAQPIAAADDLLNRLHLSSLVVVDDGWPVGTFSKLEALAARDLSRDTPVGTVIDASMICMPATVRMYRAAAHASKLDSRRVIVTRGHEVVGIIGGLDFARVATTS